MADIKITLTIGDYARLMPLITGAVKPAGIDLNIITSDAGSWPSRAEMLRRAMQDPDVQGGESSVAQHLYRIEKGDRSMVGLPVYPMRNFGARDIYVRKGSPLRVVADLAGKRLGSYSYTASGSVWYRHFLRHAGLDPATVQWVIGDVDSAWSTGSAPALPPGVEAAPGGRALSDLLIAGDIDAMLSPPLPLQYDAGAGPIVRLIPEFRTAEQAYYRASKCWPPQHLLAIRRGVWEANRFVAKSLIDAFVRCDAAFNASLRHFPYGTPWLAAEMESVEALMGQDFFGTGLERTRHEIDVFAKEAQRSGLTARRVGVDEYFAEVLQG
jgi:4,5-dihydroxyphthalate decarboxylase